MSNLNSTPAPATASSLGVSPGFHLHRLEVRNWGTFHEHIHILDAGGRTALLIGENGSGKSTLVDALLTLLVPRAKRNYNLSAGGAKKKERDEKTYVLGAYGSKSESDESRAQTKFLRKAGGQPSILLACFVNATTCEAVSLAQILWLQEDDVKKLFLVSKRERCISQDFEGLGESRTWKKTLRNRGFEVEDGFTEYAEKAVLYLRMQSVTTLALFSQTVAIKEITHVSTFIRDHMLERLDSKDLIDRLERHYQDLKNCWEAIQDAKKQLQFLEPIVHKAKDISLCNERLRVATDLRDALPSFFALQLKGLLTTELASLSEQIQALDAEIHGLTTRRAELEQQRFSLKQAIDNDEVGKELTRIQEELNSVRQSEQQRRSLAKQYQSCIADLGLKEEIMNEPRFLELRQWAESEQAEQSKIITIAANEKAVAEQEFAKLRKEYESLEDELRSLRERPDLIPERERKMRLFIANGAGVEVQELPFAGELMDVKDSYSERWRGALERLLRGFGLSLLLPERFYSRVNRFINDHNLRGRVVYHRVPAEIPRAQPSHDKGRVIERMKLKQGHPLSPWIENDLRTHFNYRCCETIEEFEHSTGFALTQQGLIRSGGTRHVKDDSNPIHDPRHYILGWSNIDKIQSLEREQNEVARAAQTQATVITASGQRQNAAADRATKAGRLQGFRMFSEIDWRTAVTVGEQLEDRRRDLEQSSDKIKKLQEQLRDVELDIQNTDEIKTDTADRRGGFKNRHDEYNRRLLDCEAALTEAKQPDLSRVDITLAELLDATPLTIVNAFVLQNKAETILGNRLLELQKSHGKHVDLITRAMANFLSEFPNLKTDLNPGEEFIPDFLRFEENVRRDDLPRHDQKFQDLMSRDVLVHVVKFQDTLDDHCEEIQSKVAHLNATLRGIEYSPRTYITIRANQTTDADIRNFRARLKGCLEYGLAPDGPSRENAFRRISDLIDMFRQKLDWSAKVTDTRNWLSFAVEERDRETEKQENVYEDTSGKSGGQKAKLAFTILASAVAYQYGIAKDRENPESFRFVVVDEMFSRSDETNSRYALQLFAKFHLQLLIVCPFDARARVVEPFVSSYHLTLNPTTQSSTVRTISVEEVKEHLARQIPSPVHANA